jgi:hypothetical protein
MLTYNREMISDPQSPFVYCYKGLGVVHGIELDGSVENSPLEFSQQNELETGHSSTHRKKNTKRKRRPA